MIAGFVSYMKFATGISESVTEIAQNLRLGWSFSDVVCLIFARIGHDIGFGSTKTDKSALFGVAESPA
ncbi:hypothetical protein [Tateyamaria sp. ANG-S1]|uniref:hypothetical protein n=1 Tax=Tateyamaria sp. ANG-S1 TaxID=1577905 RepID=UPI00057E97A4|nr:hypothetical protein [Tateyamaria sp. ANG-S1]KIC48867.1 hypothetical protein RA29_14455 [Tateyamaria sp. ANG-S1]